MKKSQQNILQSLGKKISDEQFQNDNSTHIFSEKYESSKQELLNKIIIEEGLKKSRKRKLLVAVAGLALVLLPCSVFAANKVISTLKINKIQTDPYAYVVSFEEETTTTRTEEVTKSPLYHSYVKLEYGYLPIGYKQDGGLAIGSTKSTFALNGDRYTYQNISVGIDTIYADKPLEFLDVVETKDLTIGDKRATFLHKNYTDQDSYSKILLIYYDDYGYYIKMFAQTAVPDDELLKMAADISVVACSKEECQVPVHPQDDPQIKALMDARKAEEASKQATTAPVIVSTSVDEGTFINIGDSFAGLSYYNTFMSNSPNLTYIVEDVEIRDSISGLNTSKISYASINDVKQLVDSNGKFKTYIQNEVVKGNGKTTLDTIVGQTSSDLRLVYVTMKLKNRTDSLVGTVDIIPTICCLEKSEGQLILPSIYTTTAINSYGGPMYCDHPSRYDENPSDTSAPPIYLQQTYNILPNEEFVYHVAYIVDASKMNNMVLFFNPQANTISTTSTLQTIIKLY